MQCDSSGYLIHAGARIDRVFCLREYLIRNCRILSRLSYFKAFKAIRRDPKTAPNGRIIEFYHKSVKNPR
jgi:hypothetical protein